MLAAVLRSVVRERSVRVARRSQSSSDLPSSSLAPSAVQGAIGETLCAMRTSRRLASR